MKFSIAIPDSSLIDETTEQDKVRKIFLIARSCAIFQIETIYIYHEKSGTNKDNFLLRTILRYLETPQYLRRSIFPKMSELKYVGILSPLKIPHHTLTGDETKIKQGDIREGIVFFGKGGKYVDAGLKKPIKYFGDEKEGRRITVQFKDGYPNLSIKQISRKEVNVFWGYEVKESSNLRSLLSNWNSSIIFTSKKGKLVSKSTKFQTILDDRLLIVFGSPERGVHEIFGKGIHAIQNSSIFNFFPEQGTETVRLEEAILGTLSIINIITRG